MTLTGQNAQKYLSAFEKPDSVKKKMLFRKPENKDHADT
jgi:hypothetical protein